MSSTMLRKTMKKVRGSASKCVGLTKKQCYYRRGPGRKNCKYTKGVSRRYCRTATRKVKK